MNKRPVRLLHTSDLHVGTDIYPEEAFRGFEAVLSQAKLIEADAILIAGDLFDHGRVSVETVDRVMNGLDSAGVPVVVLPGNHDTILTSDNWDRATPDNVTILKEPEGDLVYLDDIGVAVWGRPVYDHAPSFHPLQGLPTRPWDGWFVPIAHGLFMDDYYDPLRSSPIAPKEISRADCDYVSLGHVHVFRDVSQNGVPAFYSGAPSGAQQKTVIQVDLHPTTGVHVSPVNLP